PPAVGHRGVGEAAVRRAHADPGDVGARSAHRHGDRGRLQARFPSLGREHLHTGGRRCGWWVTGDHALALGLESAFSLRVRPDEAPLAGPTLTDGEHQTVVAALFGEDRRDVDRLTVPGDLWRRA